MNYIRCGKGKDLVFLHGYLSSKESFYPQIEYFSRYYRVTAPDFPGFGEGGELTQPYSVGDYADWLLNWLREVGVEYPHVIAHSFGGRVAVKCLSRGNVFDRAVLCGCAGIVPKRTLQYRVRVKTYQIMKRIAPKYAQKHFGSEEYRTLSPVMRESYKKIVNEDLRADAAKILNPALLIYGKDDKVTPPYEEGEIFNSLIKNSRLEIIEGDHFCFCRNPELFNHKVLNFLN